MKLKRSITFLLLIAVASGVGCKRREPQPFTESGRTAEAPIKDVPRDILATQQAFTLLSQKVTPSVVNISAMTRRKADPFFEFSPFFDDFFDGNKSRPKYRRESSLGSGFIISKEGYILTNDHVVRDAESIQVKLSNEKVYKGKVIGSDPKTDIAVIKINAGEALPFAVLGDSDKLQVGQWAIAIGNPFGLDRTFTVGVISATGRSNMGIETYEDFIQTDASINPGNSGGPLLNIYGEVVGINTAIVASGQGIGFAIPINMAKHVVEQLIKTGKVIRGWLGVSIQAVTPEIAQSFNYSGSGGALVSDVMDGSPAAKAGVEPGDIIIGFAGKKIDDVQHLQRYVAETPIGTQAEVEIFRKGKALKLPISITNADAAESKRPKIEEPASQSWMGMTVEEIPPEAKRRGVAGGVMITEIDPESLAAEAGLQRGDIIMSLNQKPISNMSSYQNAIKDAEKRGSAALLVKRGDGSMYFAFRIE